jgi:UDP-N-acetylmuramate: L-alanyl-gamma-D-glutamyl-meso-diaminopimelate ligase
VFCYTANLGWDAAQALASLGKRAVICDKLEPLIEAVALAAMPGDYVLIMSNGGFGGIHEKLLRTIKAMNETLIR